MGEEGPGLGGWPPAPGGEQPYLQKDDHWSHYDSSVSAVSFGFVATAILIAMFLVMAIFEKLLRTTPPTNETGGGRRRPDIEAPDRIGGPSAKLGYQSPIIPAKAREVSVVMPGDSVPTFLAHPAPVPCHPERISWPSHHRSLLSEDDIQ